MSLGSLPTFSMRSPIPLVNFWELRYFKPVIFPFSSFIHAKKITLCPVLLLRQNCTKSPGLAWSIVISFPNLYVHKAYWHWVSAASVVFPYQWFWNFFSSSKQNCLSINQARNKRCTCFEFCRFTQTTCWVYHNTFDYLLRCKWNIFPKKMEDYSIWKDESKWFCG